MKLPRNSPRGPVLAAWTWIVLCGVSLTWGWYHTDITMPLSQRTPHDAYAFGALTYLTLWILSIPIGFAGVSLLRRDRRHPLPIDPDLPPTQLIYIQGDKPEMCACHGKPIEDGALIWHWPQPAKLVCVKKDESV